MHVLVTAASKHGATAEIAVAIAASIEEAGHHAVVARPEELLSIEGYEAVVLGSAVYAGRWLEEARGFVKRHRGALAKLPVWLFSSGPLGDPLKPDADPVDVTAIFLATHARQHRLFPGRLAKHQLGFAERAIVIALRAPDGDFRPWNEIDTWGREIGHALDAEPASEVETDAVAQPVG
jgi:menaquinone-dependent protoporphyrinogen oxidase